MQKNDLYTLMASRVNGVSYDQVTEQQREAIEKEIAQAGHRGSLSSFEKMVLNTRCTVTSEGPVGELVLTGSFKAVMSALHQLHHQKVEDPVVVNCL